MENKTWEKLESAMKKKFGKTADEMHMGELLIHSSMFSNANAEGKTQKEKSILEVMNFICDEYLRVGADKPHSINPKDKENIMKEAVRKLSEAGLR